MQAHGGLAGHYTYHETPLDGSESLAEYVRYIGVHDTMASYYVGTIGILQHHVCVRTAKGLRTCSETVQIGVV